MAKGKQKRVSELIGFDYKRWKNEFIVLDCGTGCSMMQQTIKIKYHDNDIPGLKKFIQGDLIDICAAETVELKAGDFKLISLGVSMKLPYGWKANVYPRSSTFKNWGVLQTNSVGQIDNSFSGTGDIWKYPIYATRDTVINKGDRICQFEIVPIMPEIFMEEVDELDEVDRGGFGSTGK